MSNGKKTKTVNKTANFGHVSLCEQESPVNKAPIGFRCNFCIEMHPTLRAICNHLRKHVQYGEVKEGHVKVNGVRFIFKFISYCYSICFI